MKKRMTVLAVLLMAVAASVCAVTFTWSSTYDNVTHYRFQFNTDKADNWIVVGPYDTKRSYDLPPGTKLYVQQSLDGGETWSKSAIGVYDPATVEYLEPEVPAEPAAGDEGPAPIPVVREDDLKKAAASRKDTEKKEAPVWNKGVKRSKRPSVTFSIPSVALDPFSGKPLAIDQYAGLGIKVRNIWAPNSTFGLHFMANLNFGMLSGSGFPENSWNDTEKSLGLDLGLQMSFLAGRKVDIYTGPAFGVDMLMWPVKNFTPAMNPMWPADRQFGPSPIFGIPAFTLGGSLYAAWDLGFEYYFSSVFSAGINARAKYWFNSFKEWDANRFTVGADLRFSISF